MSAFEICNDLFDIQYYKWLLSVDQSFVKAILVIIICATLFINPNIADQVMVRHEQVSLKFMHKV